MVKEIGLVEEINVKKTCLTFSFTFSTSAIYLAVIAYHKLSWRRVLIDHKNIFDKQKINCKELETQMRHIVIDLPIYTETWTNLRCPDVMGSKLIYQS